MTVPRVLLVLAALIGSALAFVSFAPPQTGKWVYMWQAYWSPFAKESASLGMMSPPVPSGANYDFFTFSLTASTMPLQPPGDYTGPWRCWSADGMLFGDLTYRNGKLVGQCRAYDNLGNLNQIFSVPASGKAITVFDAIDRIDRRAEFGIEVK